MKFLIVFIFSIAVNSLPHEKIEDLKDIFEKEKIKHEQEELRRANHIPCAERKGSNCTTKIEPIPIKSEYEKELMKKLLGNNVRRTKQYIPKKEIVQPRKKQIRRTTSQTTSKNLLTFSPTKIPRENTEEIPYETTKKIPHETTEVIPYKTTKKIPYESTTAIPDTIIQVPDETTPWENDISSRKVMHFFNISAFEKHLKNDKRPMLTMFYQPWCKISNRLLPEFAKAATEIDRKKYVLSAMNVNKTENTPAIETYDINKYPTVLYFENGKQNQLYKGKYNKSGILKFMTDEKERINNKSLKIRPHCIPTTRKPKNFNI